MKDFEEMKKDNKGFSLVELIVVIAIMVVLVAVLGSTILGYVEDSRYARDIQGLDAINTACTVIISDADANWSAARDKEATLTQLLSAKGNDKMKQALADVFSFPKAAAGDAAAGDAAAGDAASGDVKGTFNNSSVAFKGLTTDDVKIIIKDGAASILVPVASGESDEFDPYVKGNHWDLDTMKTEDKEFGGKSS